MKRLIAVFLTLLLIGSLAGCGSNNEITLKLAFGEKTGTYSGETNEEGIPHGQGKFTTKNAEGETWTYEGEFKNGHFEGEGKTTWESGQMEVGTYKDDVLQPISKRDMKAMYSDPESYKNHRVEFTGVVFGAPEYSEDAIAVQLFSDVKNHDNNTIVYIFDDEFEVDDGDYLWVSGLVGEVFNGENRLGVKLTIPTVVATEYKVLDYKDAMAPTLKEITVDKTLEQYGYSVHLQKVEFAETETRLYVEIKNDGSDTFNMWTHSAKITQNGKQYDVESNWEADYPELQHELLVGSSSEGVVVFPAMDAEDFSLILEGHSDNWEEEIEPFVFDVEC